MKSLRRHVIQALICVAVVIGFVEGFRWIDSQFRYENIAYHPEFFSVQTTSQVSPEVVEILKQPFTYLDRGKQSFAFVSEDGKYVLKFFDQSRLRQWKDKNAAEKRVRQVVAGYAVADKHDRDHVGLLFAQLKPTGDSLPVVVLKDRFGMSHSIDLSQVPFVLQKRATPTYKAVSQYLDSGNRKGAHEALEAILAMYADEHLRGVYDDDHNVMHNTGFVDEVPIRIDAGRLKIEEVNAERSAQEIRKIQEERIQGWLKRHY